MKSLFDLGVAVVVAMFLAMPILIVVLAVRPTPLRAALYWGCRLGRFNCIFKASKFRSTRIDTPAVPTHLRQPPEQWLTLICSFLRKSSLGELRRLWCLLKSDMSFVGSQLSAVQPGSQAPRGCSS